MGDEDYVDDDVGAWGGPQPKRRLVKSEWNIIQTGARHVAVVINDKRCNNSSFRAYIWKLRISFALFFYFFQYTYVFLPKDSALDTELGLVLIYAGCWWCTIRGGYLHYKATSEEVIIFHPSQAEPSQIVIIVAIALDWIRIFWKFLWHWDSSPKKNIQISSPVFYAFHNIRSFWLFYSSPQLKLKLDRKKHSTGDFGICKKIVYFGNGKYQWPRDLSTTLRLLSIGISESESDLNEPEWHLFYWFRLDQTTFI